MQGKVKFFKKDKGFGFLVPTEGASEGEVFFHESQAVKGYQPQEGDNVIFDLGQGRDGRTSATKVAPYVVKEDDDGLDYDADGPVPRKQKPEEQEPEDDELILEHRSAFISSVNDKLLQEYIENPELLTSISQIRLEILVAKLMEDMGYIVSFIESGTDGVRYIVSDYVLPNNDTCRTIVECHKCDPTKKIEGQIIERFLFVIEKKNFAHKGWIVANTSFSSEALKYENEYSWKLSLKDNNAIRKLLSDYSNNQNKSDSGFYALKHEFIPKNPKQDKKKYLIELLMKDELEICTKELYIMAEMYSPDSDLSEEAFILAARLTRIEKNFRETSKISFMEYNLERNRIGLSVYRLTNLIFKLPFY